MRVGVRGAFPCGKSGVIAFSTIKLVASWHPEACASRPERTTALFADECQSFLDNVIASFGRHGQWYDPHRELRLDGADHRAEEHNRIVPVAGA
jgi:hypothetical protein